MLRADRNFSDASSLVNISKIVVTMEKPGAAPLGRDKGVDIFVSTMTKN